MHNKKTTNFKRALCLFLSLLSLLSVFSLSASAAATTIPTGEYTITSALKSNLVLDAQGGGTSNGTNLWVYTASQNNAAQIFRIERVSGGWHKIINPVSGKAVDVSGGVKRSGVNVQLYEYNGTDAQLWKFIPISGKYYIQNKLGYYLDVQNGTAASGTNVWVYSGNGTTAQRWSLTSLSSKSPSNYEIIKEKDYVITTALKSNLALDIQGGSKSNGANVQIYTKSQNNGAQIFRITHVRDGWHKIINKNSQKAIDVANGTKGSGINIWQYGYNGTDAQLFRFIPTSGGYFIQNKLGYYLDVQNGTAAAGTNVWVYSGNGSKAQIWSLSENKNSNQSANTTINVTPTSSSAWDFPMKNTYVCGNDWNTRSYSSKRPDRPYHCGIDIKSRSGDTAVLAAADGTIVKTGTNKENGKYVIMQHTIDGKTVYSFYAHLKSIKRTSGTVSRGTQIGVVGNTGNSSKGVHLHFAITDTLKSAGSYYGYIPAFTGNRARYSGVTFYNPHYVINNDRLPS